MVGQGPMHVIEHLHLRVWPREMYYVIGRHARMKDLHVQVHAADTLVIVVGYASTCGPHWVEV